MCLPCRSTSRRPWAVLVSRQSLNAAISWRPVRLSHHVTQPPYIRLVPPISPSFPYISPSSPLYLLHDRRCPQLLAVSASPVTVGHTAVTRRGLPANALAGSVHCTVTVSQRVSLHRPQPVSVTVSQQVFLYRSECYCISTSVTVS